MKKRFRLGLVMLLVMAMFVFVGCADKTDSVQTYLDFKDAYMAVSNYSGLIDYETPAGSYDISKEEDFNIVLNYASIVDLIDNENYYYDYENGKSYNVDETSIELKDGIKGNITIEISDDSTTYTTIIENASLPYSFKYSVSGGELEQEVHDGILEFSGTIRMYETKTSSGYQYEGIKIGNKSYGNFGFEITEKGVTGTYNGKEVDSRLLKDFLSMIG